jgi:hypothetical protein
MSQDTPQHCNEEMEEIIFLVMKFTTHQSLQVKISGKKIAVIENGCESCNRFKH